MKKFSICGVIIGLVFVGWYTFGSRSPKSYTASVEEIPQDAVRITLKDGTFQPAEISISQGTLVAFINKSGDFFWPASDLHPTHDVYPGFDPLEPVADGSVWIFQFNKTGVWKFHDHIRSSRRGTVTVTE